MALDSDDNGSLIGLDLPEYGRISLPLAGIGGRALAALLDVVILSLGSLILVVALGVAISGDLLAAELGLPALIAIGAAVPIIGPLFFELGWRGQTPGKRLLNIRVISTDGGVPTAGQLVLRNALRLVDFLPFAYLAGLIAMFISARGQRLGDLVGGTLVVREDPGALAELSFSQQIQVPPDLHGIPETILRGAVLLMDPTRILDPGIRQRRMADVAAIIRTHRPDLVGESDDAIFDRVRRALGASE